MISTSDFNKGLKIVVNDDPYEIMECENVLRGRGQGFVRTKLKNLRDGTIISKKFESGDTVEGGNFRTIKMQLLYEDQGEYTFMNTDSYQQVTFHEDQLEDEKLFLKEGELYDILLWEGKPLRVNLPPKVEMEIDYAPPGVKGDSATGRTKKAKTKTGLEVKVPLFIEEGEKIIVDTRTTEYVSRA